MVIISKGKSVRVTNIPEDEDNPSRDLANEMKKSLHKLNEVKEEDDDS